MTSFLISYQDLPFRAVYYNTVNEFDASLAFDVDYPVTNWFAGERGAWGQLATATSDQLIVRFDLGSGGATTFDHLAFAGVSTLISNGATFVDLRGSNNNVTYNVHMGNPTGSFGSSTRMGPNLDDLLFTRYGGNNINNTAGPLSGNYRFWQVTFYGGTQKYPISKFHVGNFLDLGKEPDFYDWEVIDAPESSWKFPRGHESLDRISHEVHRVTVEYDGLTDAQVTEISDKLLKDPYRRTVFLCALTYTEVLFGNSMLHCRVVAEECSIERTDLTDWNNVRLVFEEMV